MDQRAHDFTAAVDRLCGEANEAAKLADELFEGEDLKTVRRELARMMETSEAKILPIVRRKFGSS